MLGARAAAPGGAELAHLRAYAHCTPSLGASHGEGEVTVLLINLHAAKSYQVRVRVRASVS